MRSVVVVAVVLQSEIRIGLNDDDDNNNWDAWIQFAIGASSQSQTQFVIKLQSQSEFQGLRLDSHDGELI